MMDEFYLPFNNLQPVGQTPVPTGTPAGQEQARVLHGTNTAAVADPSGAGRYLAAGIGAYLVHVDKSVQAGVGPAGEPYDPDPSTPDEPFEDLVTVGSVGIDVIGRTPQSDLGE